MFCLVSPQSQGKQIIEHTWRNGKRKCRKHMTLCKRMQKSDRVLVKNLTPRGGTGKLRSFWEENIHVVIRKVGEEIQVYELKPEQGRGRSRILHRNILLPCDHLPLETQPKTAAMKNKRITETAAKNTHQEESED
ncbi:hypothetical protein N1851_000487 [Merluccius polli]|uniref:Uncharacterized protein n=1 Tax=Merluccius polli TaxID=89951 RepID=A0AA47NDG2_MERPO|nr:hypothetical protein N1851_000487 [Merluccius polli]